MPKLSPEIVFHRVMGKLLSDRKGYKAQIQKLQAKVAQIDGMFEEFGISLEPVASAAPTARKKPGPKPGRKPGPKARGGRRVFAVTAEEFLLDYITKTGKPSTAEIRKHWDAAGRGGKADNPLSKMVAAGKLKRVKDKGVRGSRYVVA